MGNLFTYLEQRGNLSFEEVPFNEVDNAILCAFSYLKIEKFMNYGAALYIKELLNFPILDKKSILFKNKEKLVDLLKKSKRFCDVLVMNLVAEVDVEEEKQFCGMTFALNKKEMCVVFRGTDETLVAWKEDFNLSFLKVIPSEKRAVSYLEKVLRNTDKLVYVCGHSKGGNLALFASIFGDEGLQSKISYVYNNDGPGINPNLLKNVSLENIVRKCVTFIPKESIIGNLFSNVLSIKMIESNAIGILQHDLYSWKVVGDSFAWIQELDERTKELCNRLNSYLNHLSDNKKRRIVNFLYEVMMNLGITNIEESIGSLIPYSLLEKYSISLEDLAFLKSIFPIFIDIFKKM